MSTHEAPDWAEQPNLDAEQNPVLLGPRGTVVAFVLATTIAIGVPSYTAYKISHSDSPRRECTAIAAMPSGLDPVGC